MCYYAHLLISVEQGSAPTAREQISDIAIITAVFLAQNSFQGSSSKGQRLKKNKKGQRQKSKKMLRD